MTLFTIGTQKGPQEALSRIGFYYLGVCPNNGQVEYDTGPNRRVRVNRIGQHAGWLLVGTTCGAVGRENRVYERASLDWKKSPTELEYAARRNSPE